MTTTLKQSSRGFTRTEAVAAIIVIVILVGLFPSFFRLVREKAYRAKCYNTLRATSLGIAQYYDDNNQTMPANNLAGLTSLSNYFANCALLFVCPSDMVAGRPFTNDFSKLTTAHCSYWYCSSSTWQDVSLKPMMWDRGTCKPNSTWPSTSPHKTAGGNIVWSDGHCSFEHTFPTNLTSSAGVLQFE